MLAPLADCWAMSQGGISDKWNLPFGADLLLYKEDKSIRRQSS